MNEVVEIMQQVAQREANTQLTTELATVTEVFPHAADDDKDNYQCTVELKNHHTPDGAPLICPRVPVAVPYLGLTCIPNIGDLVLVQFIGGDINAPVITSRLYNDEDRPPANEEGEFQLQHSLKEGGTLKLDKEGVLTLTSKSEENVFTLDDEKVTITNEKLMLEIDFSGEKISIRSTGDIELTADGNLSLSGNEVSIESKAALKMDAGSSLDMSSSAAMKLKGATIDLN
ncbi:MAG: phage baseplate assembly protein V [Bacteroidota bacterium]